MERYGYQYRVSYTAQTNYDSDQLRRPVIVDADSRKGAVVSPTPLNRDGYGNKTETNFLQSQKPLESESSQVLRTYPNSRKEFAVTEDKRNKNRTSDNDQRQDAEEFISKVRTGFNRNNVGYGDRNDYSNKNSQQNSPKSPVLDQNNGGYGDRNYSSSQDLLQTSPKSTEYNGSNNKDWQKLDAHTDRNDSYEDYPRKPTSAKPHHVSWAKPAENSLSPPTGDITTALGHLIEAAKPTVISHITAATGTSIPAAFFASATKPSVPNSSQYSSYAEPVYTKTTQVKDPEKRYGWYNFSSKSNTTRI